MNKNMKYLEFLKLKSVIDPNTGLTTIPALNPMLYSHQADMVKWALRRGRAALFADCGIGKGPMQMGRKFVGSELKQSYFVQACQNIESAKSNQGGLFMGEE